MKMNWSAWAAIATLGAIGFTGCTPNNETDTHAEKAGVKMKEAASETGKAAEDATTKTGQAMRQAGKDVADTTKEAGDKMKAGTADAATTAKVKNALMTTNQKLEWNGIDVDTADGVVNLKGHVPTADQKSKAGSIAKTMAGDSYKINNVLEVRAK